MNMVCAILAKKPKMGVGMEWLFGAALVTLVVGATAAIVGSIAIVTTPVTTLVIALVIIAFGVSAISLDIWSFDFKKQWQPWFKETWTTSGDGSCKMLKKKKRGNEQRERERAKKDTLHWDIWSFFETICNNRRKNPKVFKFWC